MMMEMLKAGGLELFTDGLRSPDGDNPRGYFEHERVKKLREGDVGWLAQAQGKAVKVISYLLPHLSASHRYQVIFMQRDLEEVLASQRTMLIHREMDPDKTDETKLRELLGAHLAEIEGWLRGQANLTFITVHYDRLVHQPKRELRRVNAFLDLDLDLESMAQVADPSLYRHRAG
jgi:hypothetical protein